MFCRRFHYFPAAFFLTSVGTFVITLAVAASRGHVQCPAAYISDTGVQAPESAIFTTGLAICAVIGSITIFIRYKQLNEAFSSTSQLALNNSLNILSLTCGQLSSVGLVMVGVFRKDKFTGLHMTGALSTFVFSCFYCWLQTFLSFKLEEIRHNTITNNQKHPKLSAWTRCLLVLLMSLLIICSLITGLASWQHFKGVNFAYWLPDDGGFEYHLISTVTEWLAAVCLAAFILTFHNEFQKISLSIEIPSPSCSESSVPVAI